MRDRFDIEEYDDVNVITYQGEKVRLKPYTLIGNLVFGTYLTGEHKGSTAEVRIVNSKIVSK